MAYDVGRTAHFPGVAAPGGAYESFYLKACHPHEPIGLWIRYTVHKRPGAAPNGSLWFTLFEAGAGGPRAVKATTADPRAGEGRYLEIGGAVFSPGTVRGETAAAGRRASWDLRYEWEADPLLHLPGAWMYRSPLPRTKLLSLHPDARFSGSAAIDDRELALDGWRGMVGHNWGSQHAERWIWLHAAGFDEDEEVWLDVGLGRIRLGPATTPWIASGALCLDGQRLRLGGVGRVRRTEVRERAERCEFVLPGRGLTVQGRVDARREDFVGWVYADPDGSEHNVVNCSIAGMALAVSRPGRPPVSLRVEGAAAYELGMRETDHGMRIEPFPDG